MQAAPKKPPSNRVFRSSGGKRGGGRPEIPKELKATDGERGAIQALIRHGLKALGLSQSQWAAILSRKLPRRLTKTEKEAKAKIYSFIRRHLDRSDQYFTFEVIEKLEDYFLYCIPDATPTPEQGYNMLRRWLNELETCAPEFIKWRDSHPIQVLVPANQSEKLAGFLIETLVSEGIVNPKLKDAAKRVLCESVRLNGGTWARYFAQNWGRTMSRFRVAQELEPYYKSLIGSPSHSGSEDILPIAVLYEIVTRGCPSAIELLAGE